MIITEVKTIMANRFLFLQITTDEGIVGIGESGAWAFQDAAREAANSFIPYLIGKDPLQIEHHWQYMYRSYHFRGAAIMGAISAIDIALWDIAGKYYGCPVYQLLGGKVRDKARVYYHVGGGEISAMVRNLKEAKEKGFTAVGHLSPFLDEPRTQVYNEGTFAKKIGDAIERVAAYREAVGNDVDLCVEIHRRLNIPEAIAFARGIEPYHPFFLEDPTTPDNFDSMAYIASRIDIPVATGERYHTPQEFAMLIKHDLPFLFTSYDKVWRVLDGEVGEILAQAAENAGFKLLYFWDNGFRNMSNNTRPINSVTDLNGLKIRVPENEVYIATWEALGAIPTPMAWSEVFSSLQLGTINGQENPNGHMQSYNLTEVQSYFTITNHVYTAEPLIINLDTFSSLSENQQNALMKAAKEAGDFERELRQQINTETIDYIKNAGVEITTPDLSEFQSAVQPVYEKYKEKYGDLLEKIQEITAE